VEASVIRVSAVALGFSLASDAFAQDAVEDVDCRTRRPIDAPIDVALLGDVAPGHGSWAYGTGSRVRVGLNGEWHIADDFSVDVAADTRLPTFDRHIEVFGRSPHENRVVKGVSTVSWSAAGRLVFAPLAGELQFGRREPTEVHLYGAVGFGVVRTRDDLEALQCEEDPRCLATEREIHPTTSLSGGVTVSLSPRMFVGAELGDTLYVETIQSVTRERTNLLAGSVRIGWSGRARRSPGEIPDAPAPG
jgi:hypothetical protein